MNNFKDFFTDLVSEVTANMNGIEVHEDTMTTRNYHSAIDRMVESYNDISSYKSEQMQKEISTSSDRALSGYDSRYMSRNDYRVAKKFQKSTSLSTRKDNEDCKWDYLFASQGLTQSKPTSVVTRQYDVTTKNPSKASVKKGYSVGKGTYIPSTPYIAKGTENYVPKYTSANTYKVVDYQILQRAIVLEVVSLDNRRVSGRFEEVADNYDAMRDMYFDVDTRNKDKNTFKVVFTSKRLQNGQEDKYSGVYQLREWLKTQKFIMEQKPERIRDAVEMLVGEVITLPHASMFTYSEEDNFHNVYTVFGESDFIDDDFTNNEKVDKYVKVEKKRKPHQLMTVPTYREYMALNH